MSIPDTEDGDHRIKEASEQVKQIVRQKIQVPESINLCLEDNSDWVNATTRKIILEVCFRVYQPSWWKQYELCMRRYMIAGDSIVMTSDGFQKNDPNFQAYHSTQYC